ncbi:MULTISPECIES: MFS transporter [Clostridia]|uniref:MFS transporter n=1 Tax=Clostridia TaxID=186801 RepID=UPI000EA3E751|nr:MULTISPECIES: MFS transporter [Clostridia]NBJ71182.1 MFS transporter [Roseburia sp. 1XD42-34]RKI75045.1 MFS transporter [Clostridium sp. 1xD42-85]
MGNSSILTPLKDKRFRRFYSMQLLSDLGNWLDFTLLILLISYQWGLGEIAVASYIIVYGLPWIIIGPFASVFVDRWSKKKVFIVTLSLRILVVLSYIIAPNIYILLTLVFIKGILASLFDPARQVTIKILIEAIHLSKAVALTQLSLNSMKVIGPSLSGLLVAIIGFKTTLIIEALLFLFALLFALAIKIPSQNNENESSPMQKAKKSKFIDELKEGFSYIIKNKKLLLTIITTALSFFIIFLYDGLIVFLSQDIGLSEAHFGFLISFVGFGAITGSLLLGQFSFWKPKPLTTVLLSFLGSGIVIFLMGVGAYFPKYFPVFVFFIFAIIIGALNGTQNVGYGFILQKETPSYMLGRVSSVAQGLQNFTMLSAPLIGAFISRLSNVNAVFILAGTLAIVISTIVLFITKIRDYDSNSKEELYQHQSNI